jgi:hypothetical protein
MAFGGGRKGHELEKSCHKACGWTSRDTACQFLRHLIALVPYNIHTILTDNGIQFTNRAKDKWAFMHLFDRICYQHEIEHRLTKVKHP